MPIIAVKIKSDILEIDIDNHLEAFKLEDFQTATGINYFKVDNAIKEKFPNLGENKIVRIQEVYFEDKVALDIVVRILGRIKTLEELEITGCYITEEALGKIATSISFRTQNSLSNTYNSQNSTTRNKLNLLNISNNRMDDRYIESIVSLINHTYPQKTDLSNNLLQITDYKAIYDRTSEVNCSIKFNNYAKYNNSHTNIKINDFISRREFMAFYEFATNPDSALLAWTLPKNYSKEEMEKKVVTVENKIEDGAIEGKFIGTLHTKNKPDKKKRYVFKSGSGERNIYSSYAETIREVITAPVKETIINKSNTQHYTTTPKAKMVLFNDKPYVALTYLDQFKSIVSHISNQNEPRYAKTKKPYKYRVKTVNNQQIHDGFTTGLAEGKIVVPTKEFYQELPDYYTHLSASILFLKEDIHESNFGVIVDDSGKVISAASLDEGRSLKYNIRHANQFISRALHYLSMVSHNIPQKTVYSKEFAAELRLVANKDINQLSYALTAGYIIARNFFSEEEIQKVYCINNKVNDKAVPIELAERVKNNQTYLKNLANFIEIMAEIKEINFEKSISNGIFEAKIFIEKIIEEASVQAQTGNNFNKDIRKTTQELISKKIDSFVEKEIGIYLQQKLEKIKDLYQKLLENEVITSSQQISNFKEIKSNINSSFRSSTSDSQTLKEKERLEYQIKSHQIPVRKWKDKRSGVSEAEFDFINETITNTIYKKIKKYENRDDIDFKIQKIINKRLTMFKTVVSRELGTILNNQTNKKHISIE
ncbi:MAG: hypothetical protein J0H68_01275 [Sphingobacteriia bacterium]|nr:hypothetical protein [Sphingobacteriia bacterium]